MTLNSLRTFDVTITAISILSVVASSLWASFDSSQLRKEGATSADLGGDPISVFLGCLLVWIVVFPLYLAKRSAFLRSRNLR
jgi:hypothetical protein